MDLFGRLGVANPNGATIDWDLTPADTFGIFESWGGKLRVRDRMSRFYYFFIDNYEKPAQLLLMERGIKFARILARVLMPQELIDRCVASQGQGGSLDQSYAIDGEIRAWLEINLLDGVDESILLPVETGLERESLETGLPRPGEPLPPFEPVSLPGEPVIFDENQIPDLMARYNFFDSRYNPKGAFPKVLVDSGDNRTVMEMRTGRMWQRWGCDIKTTLGMQTQVVTWNQGRFAGHDGWYIPTIQEALSLLEPEKNEKGLYLPSCFSLEQPFIFLANGRKPGGQWYIDFLQGTVFYASGSNPGGFGRCCRMLG